MSYVDVSAKRVEPEYNVVNRAMFKTIRGYLCRFAGYKIELDDLLFDKIQESILQARQSNNVSSGSTYSYWLGVLLSKSKSRYKRVRCFVCKKYIHKKDTMKNTGMMRRDIHKQCYEKLKKKENAEQLLRDGDKEFKEIHSQRKRPGRPVRSPHDKIQSSVEKALNNAKMAEKVAL